MHAMPLHACHTDMTLIGAYHTVRDIDMTLDIDIDMTLIDIDMTLDIDIDMTLIDAYYPVFHSCDATHDYST